MPAGARRPAGLRGSAGDPGLARAIRGMCIGLGVVFLWFGALKLFPGVSPAESLVSRTVQSILPPDVFLRVLALWECAIGVGLLLRCRLPLVLVLLGFHMAGTFLPLLTCPEEVWRRFPHVLTLEGQYIVKNLVLIAAAITVGTSLRSPAAGVVQPHDETGTRWRGSEPTAPDQRRT